MTIQSGAWNSGYGWSFPQTEEVIDLRKGQIGNQSIGHLDALLFYTFINTVIYTNTD
jgi:hypothetical protein